MLLTKLGKPRQRKEYEYVHWKSEDDEILTKMINEGKSYNEVAKVLNRTSSSVKSRSRQVLKLKYDFQKRYFDLNMNYWAEPNPETFYWTGFIAADGAICGRGRVDGSFDSDSLTIELSIRDLHHLEKFRKSIGYGGEIKHCRRKNRDNYHTVKLRINSQKWVGDLCNNFNLVPNKTKILAPPKFNNDIELMCWIMGAIDGDGSLYIISSKTKYGKPSKALGFHYSSSSKICLDFIKESLDRLFPPREIKGKMEFPEVKLNTSKSYWVYGFGGARVAKMIDFMQNLPCPRLSRKWHDPEIQEMIGFFKQKYPEYFTPIPQSLLDLKKEYDLKNKNQPLTHSAAEPYVENEVLCEKPLTAAAT